MRYIVRFDSRQRVIRIQGECCTTGRDLLLGTDQQPVVWRQDAIEIDWIDPRRDVAPYVGLKRSISFANSINSKWWQPRVRLTGDHQNRDSKRSDHHMDLQRTCAG